ncbi:PH domain-containing protein [Paraburkholderia fungorum]|uniref:PH domain-containing protein n=1 Tax=Paraburkholderia fungorum TaxID=134537 RepID=UPI0038BA0A91
MTGRTTNLMPASAQPTVIFHGTPSQVINVPDLFGTSVAIGGLAVVFSWAASRWTVSPGVVVAPVLVCLAWLALVFVETALTEIVIDMERITCRQGILTRKVSSLELFRIQDVISLNPWWQRVFNVGTVVILTSDSSNPRWYLPGMVNAEQMRNALNRAAVALRDYKGIREVNMGRV